MGEEESERRSDADNRNVSSSSSFGRLRSRLYSLAFLLEILHALKDKGIDVAVASRSPTPDTANTFLQKLSIDSIFVAKEIFSSWTHKTDHFQRIHSRTAMPFNSMLFFDDEDRNIQSVSKMGVTSILVGKGVNLGALRQGLTKFSQNWSTSEKNKQKWQTKFCKKSNSSEGNDPE